VYVKANTPIPMWPVLNFDGERAPDPLTWLIHVANADAGEFTAYEDAGEGYDYQQGEFCRMRAECRVDSKRVEVRLEAPEGQYVAPRSQIEVELRGVGEPQAVTVDDQAARDAAREGSRLLVRLGAGEGHVISVET
jgi:alpha-glucosidase